MTLHQKFHLGGNVHVTGRMAPMRTTGAMTINGQRIEGGHVVEVRNGILYVDEKTADVLPTSTLVLTIHGDVVTGGVHTTSGEVTINGNVRAGSVSTVGGAVDVNGDVAGNVSTVGGDVRVEGVVRGTATSTGGRVRGQGAAGSKKRKTSVRVEEVYHIGDHVDGVEKDDVLVMHL